MFEEKRRDRILWNEASRILRGRKAKQGKNFRDGAKTTRDQGGLELLIFKGSGAQAGKGFGFSRRKEILSSICRGREKAAKLITEKHNERKIVRWANSPSGSTGGAQGLKNELGEGERAFVGDSFTRDDGRRGSAQLQGLRIRVQRASGEHREHYPGTRNIYRIGGETDILKGYASSGDRVGLR